MEQVREKETSSHDGLQAEPERDPYIGREIGNLRITQKVGIGGFGAVYRAEHMGLKTSFAIKVLHFQMQSAPRAAERFRREAMAIASLSHRNIVRVSDFGEFNDGGSYLVMDFLAGQNLEDSFQSGQRFDLFAIRDLVDQICDALEYIHRKGVVHRDLKPANISLEQEDGETILKLFDFGIAALEEDASITHTGVCMGSPLYMSPEQAVGETKHADGRTDLYSLGVITYELLAGFPPFQGSVKSVMYKQVHQKPFPLREVRAHINWSKTLERMLQKALAKAPEERFQDAAAFREAFHEACDAQLRKTPDGKLWSDEEEQQLRDSGGLTAMGIKDSFDVDALRRRRRLRPFKIMAAVSLASLLLGAGLWYLWLWRHKATPAVDVRPLQPGASQNSRQAAARTQAPRPSPRAPRPAPRSTGDRTTPPPRRRTYSLLITSSPKRAWVYHNGKKKGRTPLRIKGQEGEDFQIEVRARGRKPRRSQGTFGEDTQDKLHLRLSRAKRRNRRKRRKKGPFDIDDPI